MQKAIPYVLFFVCLFTMLITNSASANDGKGGNHGTPVQTSPGFAKRDLHRFDLDPKSGSERGWLGNLGKDIGDFFSQLFGHHHNHPSPGNHPGGVITPAAPASGGSAAPGSPSVPFDGGIGLLLAAGLGLGLKMARDRYKMVAVKA